MARQEFSERYVAQYPWENVATITVQEAALSADELNSVYIEALGTTKAGIYSPKNGQVAFEIRARSDGANNDVNAVEFYGAAKDLVPVEFYRRIATLTWTQGLGEFWPTAVDPNPATIFFADELAESNNSWISTTPDVGVDASADYATSVLNNHGYYKFAFIVSTLASTTVYIDIRRF